jgi:hypothetical protein
MTQKAVAEIKRAVCGNSVFLVSVVLQQRIGYRNKKKDKTTRTISKNK